MCDGGHQLVDKVACCATQIGCGSRCLKDLACGLHKCEKTCHAQECLTEKNVETNGCGQVCQKMLSCHHACPSKCHPGKECITTCNQKVKIFCECRHLTGMKECDELRKMVKNSHPNVIFNIAALPAMIDCNSECRMLARNKKLAEAFNIDLVKHDLPTFGRSLISFGIKNPKFVIEVESVFSTLLENESAIKHGFPSMSADKRSFIHELSSFYDLVATSVDRAPYKSVVVTKTLKSHVPPIRLSVVLSDTSKLKILEEKLSTMTIQQKEEPQSRTYQKMMKEMKLMEGEESEEEEKDDWETVGPGDVVDSKLKQKKVDIKNENFWNRLQE